MTSPNGHYGPQPGQELAELGAMLGEVGVDPRTAAVVVAYTQQVIASATVAALKVALNAIREGHEARHRELTKMVEQMPRLGRYTPSDQEKLLRLAQLQAAPEVGLMFTGPRASARRDATSPYGGWPTPPPEPSHYDPDGK